jgi:hypothetical protein
MPYVVLVDDNYPLHGQQLQVPGRRVRRPPKRQSSTAGRSSTSTSNRPSSPECRRSELWDSYKSFGEDPFIVATDETPASFSAWSYASQRCEERTGDRIVGGRYLTRDDPEHEDYDPMR